MGHYTRIVLAAELKTPLPDLVLESLRYIIGQPVKKPAAFALPAGRCEWLLNGNSEYFEPGTPNSFAFEIEKGAWVIKSCSCIKNYENEIETFIAWLQPFIKNGLNENGSFAAVDSEDDENPEFYFIKKKE